MAEFSQKQMILVGADDPLPPDHFWFDGEDFSVYTAKQPKSTWKEHVHDCVQVTVGLEPAHMHAEWRSGASLRQTKELIGNAVTVIPAEVPHRTLWQRQAALIHIYIRNNLLQSIARELWGQSSFELTPTYLVRDLLIEEIARSLYLESASGSLNPMIAAAAVTTLCVRLLRAYSAREGDSAYASGGLGPSRERRVRDYIEGHLEADLSLHALGGGRRHKPAALRCALSAIHRLHSSPVCQSPASRFRSASACGQTPLASRRVRAVRLFKPKPVHHHLPKTRRHDPRPLPLVGRFSFSLTHRPLGIYSPVVFARANSGLLSRRGMQEA